ncbi:MAG: glycerophosphodiester phosphodiesterase family protein [Mobilicoccus sp.]|nr:glycerophosphodiester phosphodiesterase family protein [Mobilicoccus sp.]
MTPFDSPPHVIAHRGGALVPGNVGRENTLVAFVAAAALGVRHLETDVHATADGDLVAAHDATLDRVSDRTGPIATATTADVLAARVGGEPIPLLPELVAALPDAVFTIDIKARGATVPLARLLRRADLARRVCVGSFSELRLWTFRILTRRRVPTSAGRIGIALLRYTPFWALLRTPGVAYQVPLSHQVGPLRLLIVTPTFVKRAHRLGKQVHVWTVDDPDQMHALLDLGVDGIITDRPDLALQVLADRRPTS